MSIVASVALARLFVRAETRREDRTSRTEEPSQTEMPRGYPSRRIEMAQAWRMIAAGAPRGASRSRLGRRHYVPDLDEHRKHDAEVMERLRKKYEHYVVNPFVTPGREIQVREAGAPMIVWVPVEMATCTPIGGPFQTRKEAARLIYDVRKDPSHRLVPLRFTTTGPEDLVAQMDAWALKQDTRNRNRPRLFCGPCWIKVS